MKRFVEGTDRGQNTLFPECLADWIDENNWPCQNKNGPKNIVAIESALCGEQTATIPW